MRWGFSFIGRRRAGKADPSQDLARVLPASLAGTWSTFRKFPRFSRWPRFSIVNDRNCRNRKAKMWIVRGTTPGNSLWQQKFEVQSLESFAQRRNEIIAEHCPTRDIYVVTSPDSVEHRGPNGEIITTYRVCKEYPGRV